MAFNRTKLFERLFSWTMHETLKKEKKKARVPYQKIIIIKQVDKTV